MTRLMISFSLALLSLSLSASEVDVAAIARATDDHYNHLKTSKADFTQKYDGPGMSRTESGILWLKKPGRMRWEYRQPAQKLFLTDAHTAWFYVSGERQAKKASLKNVDDIRSPLRYLLGKTRLEKELTGLSLAPDVAPVNAGDVVLRGVPKGMTDRISSVVLEISPSHQITRIVINEVDGASTDFRFTNVEENVPVQETLFHFEVPPGVQVIEDNQIGQ
ncbi:MAG TPA: outer membrane lipoprotein carrier protein LolA [Candidatus Angelobacter sp.]|nr:outer membrane lipoprotein carrier protein LolA [Candidatus Angelobacter sp.]